MPIFVSPYFFFVLLGAVPALLAIYWLRNRARERQVSSLLLWLEQRQVWDGGRRFDRLQMPLLLFLELAALLLLVAAAAKPLLRAGESAKPLVVVLDDSFSMLAGNENSTQQRALAAIEGELRANRYEPVRFVLAGEQPQLLGANVNKPEQLGQLLANWRCGAARAKLAEAVGLAFEIGGKRARVLVVSDQAPPENLSDSRLQWWAFGQAHPNLAFVNAVRTTRGDEDLLLLEIANLANSSTNATLSLEEKDNPQSALHNTQSFQLAAQETKRFTFKFKAGVPALRATLTADELHADNEAILLPEAPRNVRMAVRVREPGLRQLIEQALRASQHALLTTNEAELIVSDEAEVKDAGAAWTLQVVSEANAQSYLGPFVVDYAHPLSEGLSLGGVVWAAGAAPQFPGKPIITAANVPLLTEIERAGGRRELRLRFQPAISTLQETPNWPVLCWNLINWRARQTPGLQQSNVRLGGEAELLLPPQMNISEVTLREPGGRSLKLPARENSLKLKAETTGVYEIAAGASKFAFAANALQKEESDLTGAVTNKWGNWANATSFEWEYRSVVWLLLLLALLVLAAHAWLAKRAAVRRGAY